MPAPHVVIQHRAQPCPAARTTRALPARPLDATVRIAGCPLCGNTEEIWLLQEVITDCDRVLRSLDEPGLAPDTDDEFNYSAYSDDRLRYDRHWARAPVALPGRNHGTPSERLAPNLAVFAAEAFSDLAQRLIDRHPVYESRQGTCYLVASEQGLDPRIVCWYRPFHVVRHPRAQGLYALEVSAGDLDLARTMSVRSRVVVAEVDRRTVESMTDDAWSLAASVLNEQVRAQRGRDDPRIDVPSVLAAAVGALATGISE